MNTPAQAKGHVEGVMKEVADIHELVILLAAENESLKRRNAALELQMAPQRTHF